MKGIIAVIFVAVFTQVYGNLLDIFEQEGQHEPQVAIYCGHVPFHADSKTGRWVSDKNGVEVCDANKDDVKKYCQKVYPELNITNIVEANEKSEIKNWCKQGTTQCTIEKKVVPYRCLVDEYEADALMVPKGCKFSHLHDQDSCLTHDEWKSRAVAYCNRDNTKLNDYGILLPCGTDVFTGVEFVCCPKKQHKNKQRTKKDHKKKQHNKKDHKKKEHKKKGHSKHRSMHKKKEQVVDRVALEKAIKDLQKYMPERTEGCDRTIYETKRKNLEGQHDKRIAAVVEAWEEAERRYKILKLENFSAAKNNMTNTLKAFRETIDALEADAKEETIRLKTEHSNCITTNINKQKREAMMSYLAAVEEMPHNAKKILRTAKAFFQAYEHDRLHSLRHFQHLRKQSAELADELKDKMLSHLQELNQVVNASINLLSYLPRVARQFGLRAFIRLTDETKIPKLVEPVLPHKSVQKKLLKAAKEIKNDVGTEQPATKATVSHKQKIEDAAERTHHDRKKTVKEAFDNESKSKLKSNTINPTDLPPKTEHGSEGLPENEAAFSKHHKKTESKKKDIKIETPAKTAPQKHPEPQETGHPFFKHPKSVAAVIGLSCGALVIMLGSIIALIMRRNQANQSHVVVVDAEPEDQEHLIKMQKSGYENPTYKFFYY